MEETLIRRGCMRGPRKSKHGLSPFDYAPAVRHIPDVKKKLEAELTAALTEPKFKELRAGMDNKIRPFQTKQQLTPQLAQQFLEQVTARAKGDEMEPDVLRYLLAVRYAANPVAEFGDGFRQRFRTDGTGK